MNQTEAQKIAEATVKKMNEKKPKWFIAHERSDAKEFWDIKKTLADQDEAFETQGAMIANQNKRLEDLITKQEEYHKLTIPVFEYLQEITIWKKIRWDYAKAVWVWTGIFLGIASVWGVVWAIFKFLVFNAR